MTTMKEPLDKQNVAAFLADGWRRYTELFGEPPHGTIRQFLAMLELSYMDHWQIMKPESQGAPRHRYGWSADPTTDRELREKYGPSIHEPKDNDRTKDSSKAQKAD